jgi:hypothetical protein
MRIYNGKNSQVDIPLATQRVTIGPKSVSKDLMPSTEMLQLLSTSFDDSEIALIVSGPTELNLCAGVPSCTPLVVQSLDEALVRFNGGDVKPEPKPEKKEEEPVAEEPVVEEMEEKEEEPEKKVEVKQEEVKPEPTKKAAPAKKNAKK